MPPKRMTGRAAIEEAVRREAGVVAATEDEEVAAGAPLTSADEARAAAARLLELDALVKPLTREIDALVPLLRAFMVDTRTALLLSELGTVALQTREVARVDQSLIPPAILAAARVTTTQHCLIRKPDLVGIRQGVGRAMVAVGPPAPRGSSTRQQRM